LSVLSWKAFYLPNDGSDEDFKRVVALLAALMLLT